MVSVFQSSNKTVRVLVQTIYIGISNHTSTNTFQNNQLFVIKSTRFRQINQRSNQPRKRVEGQPPYITCSPMGREIHSDNLKKRAEKNDSSRNSTGVRL